LCSFVLGEIYRSAGCCAKARQEGPPGRTVAEWE